MIYKLLDCVDINGLDVKMFGCGYFIVESELLPQGLNPFVIMSYNTDYVDYRKDSIVKDCTIYNLMGSAPTTNMPYSGFERIK